MFAFSQFYVGIDIGNLLCFFEYLILDLLVEEDSNHLMVCFETVALRGGLDLHPRDELIARIISLKFAG